VVEIIVLGLEKKLSRIINDTTGERDVLRFLAKHPKIVYWAFYTGAGHGTYVIKEFPFGSHYKADFVVPMASSGIWEVHMIELEPPNDKVINKDGTPSHRFNKALSQIRDWESYIKENLFSFRKDLSDWCMKHDLLGLPGSSGPPCNFTDNYLRDSDTHIWFYYHIVIGRRDRIIEEQRRKMIQISQSHHCLKVCTYGTFLDIARNLDKREANPNAPVSLADTEKNA
jgi:hypothetical protein